MTTTKPAPGVVGLFAAGAFMAIAGFTVFVACPAAPVEGDGRQESDLLASSTCRLCNKWSGKEVARICSSCASKAGSNCVLCGKWSGREVARICSSCANKAGSNCVLCSKWSAKEVARICTSCSNK